MADMMEPKVFDRATADDVALEQLGYQQELKRTFNLVSMIGFCFSIVSSWTALSGVLIIGAESGGPPVMIWSWVGVCVFTMAVALSMAEMCSAYPLAGGQYSWAAILAPRSWSKGLSYVCGWFMLIGIIAMGAVVNFIASGFILAIAVLNNPEYEITRWHSTLVAYAIAIAALSLNVLCPQMLHKMTNFFLIWNMGSFLIIFITILATNDHKQTPSFVFSEFQNFTGFNKPYAAILGLLQSAFGMCCYDAPAHMTEEINDARKVAPKAIILSVSLGAVTGFAFLIAACFCMGSIEGVAESATGDPIVQIFYDSTQSVAGASCLTFLMVMIQFFSAISLLAEGGRAVYAFARDRGLPFSSTSSKVHPKKQVPIYGILLTFVVQIALNSIYFGTVTGFNTVVSIATEGFYVSYAIPILLRVIAPLTASTAAAKMEGPWSLGRWSMPINIMALVYLLFTSITFNFPSISPVDSENMNYTSAAVGVVMVIATITWFTTAKSQYTVPGMIEDVVIESAPHREVEEEAEMVGDEKHAKASY
ncbi:GABA permease [Aureobasidium pullulans]|nr:GABA permease [Aureobasidium pullulans]